MAVALEFIDFIVPIRVIEEKYPGGWKQCLIDHRRILGGRAWYDEHLLRDGAMNPADIGDLLEEWTGLGFTPFTDGPDGRIWVDVCVVESAFGGPSLPCSWITVDLQNRTAYLAGTLPGPLVDREAFVAKHDQFLQETN